MAIKKYAYYNKGNKIALVEKDVTTSSGNKAVAHCTIGGHSTKATCEAAGGQWIPGSSGTVETLGRYKSPVDGSEKGLEIEYSYSPTYNLRGLKSANIYSHKFLGWGSDGTYLVFFTYGATSVKNVSSFFSADQWILVEGSGMWDGLHKVKDNATDEAKGILHTWTQFTLPWNKLNDVIINYGTNEVIDTAEAAVGEQFALLKENEIEDELYIMTTDSANTVNDRIMKITLDRGDNSNLGTATTYYYFSGGNRTFQSATPSFTEADDDTVDIWRVHLHEITIHENVDVIEDESFELDLTRGQGTAITYFLKAKDFEDRGDMEAREYFMKQFYKQLEKESNSRSYGPRIVQGKGMTRT